MEMMAQLPSRISRIVLVGFMGAGKSTVGALLAQHLRWQFLDADRVLEERVGASIAEIFAKDGEAAFRSLESQVIRDLLSRSCLVLALGGGAVETQTVREALLNTQETCVIFLEAPLEVMIARCEHQPGADVRPVLNDRGQLRRRFDSRLPHYRNAHLVIKTESLTAEETSLHIFNAVNSLLKENAPA